MENKMTESQPGQNVNPLKKYYRQPKQFIRLPSGYKYYPEGAIEVSESGEIAVYPMTAKDELIFKTPDALLNGEATVTVIQSCVPAIKNAWQMPSIDVDATLIAIRMATYGTKMSVPIMVPNTKIEKDYELDLQVTLDKLLNAQYQSTALVGNMEITTQPLSYDQFSKMAIKTFEEARVQEIIKDQDMDEEEKLKRFQKSLTKLTDLNISMVGDTVASVKVDGQTVTDRDMITEFIENAEKGFFQAVLDHLELQRQAFALPTITVDSTEEEQKAGAPEQYTIPVQFDTANFFA
mgnify:FL=1|jgi:hypothetical protein|tara:strand:- start:230 stop:1108 length:879 start_codon:yes stop_codon:yes gene_type:complete